MLSFVVFYALLIQWFVFYWFEEDDRSQLALCHHEMGHSLLVCSCSETTSFISATIKAKQGGGLTTWKWAEHNGTDLWWCSLVIDIAGLIGEELFLGYGSIARANVDLAHAFETSAMLLSLGSTKPPWKVKEPAHIELGKHFDNAPAEQVRMVNLAAETARTIIKAYGKRATAFSEELLVKKALYEADATRILGSRESIRFQGTIATFWVSKEVLAESGIKPMHEAA
jgi:hypothetical protein